MTLQVDIPYNHPINTILLNNAGSFDVLHGTKKIVFILQKL